MFDAGTWTWSDDCTVGAGRTVSRRAVSTAWVELENVTAASFEGVIEVACATVFMVDDLNVTLNTFTGEDCGGTSSDPDASWEQAEGNSKK